MRDVFFAGGDIALATAAGAWLGLEQSLFFVIYFSLIFIVYALPFRFLKLYMFLWDQLFLWGFSYVCCNSINSLST
uniref:Uncharacterized protein n=1 Tax=Escherichia coli TaxID=562 RepID=A0A6M9X698_ECOLX|nr:hypothetical protein [Escherichia coli]QKN61157.1 hypothetical protein HHJ25_23485 [Escherichia coli]